MEEKVLMKGEKLDYSRWNLVSLKCGYLITVDDYHEPYKYLMN